MSLNKEAFDETLAEFFKINEKVKKLKKQLAVLKKEVQETLHADKENVIKCSDYTANLKFRCSNKKWQEEEMKKHLGPDFYPEFEKVCKFADSKMVEIVEVLKNVA